MPGLRIRHERTPLQCNNLRVPRTSPAGLARVEIGGRQKSLPRSVERVFQARARAIAPCPWHPRQCLPETPHTGWHRYLACDSAPSGTNKLGFREVTVERIRNVFSPDRYQNWTQLNALTRFRRSGMVCIATGTIATSDHPCFVLYPFFLRVLRGLRGNLSLYSCKFVSIRG